MWKVGRQTSQMEVSPWGLPGVAPIGTTSYPWQRPGLCQAVGGVAAGVRGQAVPEQRACGRPPGPLPGPSVLERVRVQGQGPRPLPAVSPRSAALGSGAAGPACGGHWLGLQLRS